MRRQKGSRVLRSHTRWISPRKWFPAENPIACGVARLCVLREDLYIEWLAMTADQIALIDPATAAAFQKPPSLDDNGVEYRRFYFLRASLHTLAEVHNAVTGLRNNKDFRKLYRAFDARAFEKLVTYIKSLDKGLSELRRIRNALGGHVSREAVKKALSTMNYFETGKFDIGRTMKDTHYGFAGTICGQILMEDLPGREARLKAQHGIIDLNLQTIGIINGVLHAYLIHYRLL